MTRAASADRHWPVRSQNIRVTVYIRVTASESQWAARGHDGRVAAGFGVGSDLDHRSPRQCCTVGRVATASGFLPVTPGRRDLNRGPSSHGSLQTAAAAAGTRGSTTPVTPFEFRQIRVTYHAAHAVSARRYPNHGQHALHVHRYEAETLLWVRGGCVARGAGLPSTITS